MFKDNNILKEKHKLLNRAIIKLLQNDDSRNNVDIKINKNILQVEYEYYGEENGNSLILNQLKYNYSDYKELYDKYEETVLYSQEYKIDLNNDSNVELLYKLITYLSNKENLNNIDIKSMLFKFLKEDNEIENLKKLDEILTKLNFNDVKIMIEKIEIKNLKDLKDLKIKKQQEFLFKIKNDELSF